MPETRLKVLKFLMRMRRNAQNVFATNGRILVHIFWTLLKMCVPKIFRYQGRIQGGEAGAVASPRKN